MTDKVKSVSGILNRVIMSNEIRCYHFNSQSKLKASHWKLPSSPTKQIFRKVILEVFPDSQGVIQHGLI